MTFEQAKEVVKHPQIQEADAVQVVEAYIKWKNGVTVNIADPRRFNVNPSPIARIHYQHELGLLMKAYEIASNEFLKEE